MNYNFSNWADIVFDKWIQLRSVFRFYTPWYRQESKGFVVLLGIMLREHCSEMGEGQFRYVLKVISQNTRCMFGICSKLKMKTTEQLYHVFSMSFGYYQHIWSSVSFITIEIVVACPHTNECYLRHIQDKSFFFRYSHRRVCNHISDNGEKILLCSDDNLCIPPSFFRYQEPVTNYQTYFNPAQQFANH